MKIKSKIEAYVNQLIDIKISELLSVQKNNVSRLDVMEEKLRNHNTMLDGYEEVFTNLRNNNVLIEQLQSVVEMQKVKIAILERETVDRVAGTQTIQKSSVEEYHESSNVYNGIDYFDFENYFRGSMEQIRENQQQYLKYFEGHSNVIDVGCGRGEFLSLLKEKGIDAQGVDLYEEFSEMCKMKGLKATCDDGIHFLKGQEKIGGIFAGQVIEHLTTNQIVELCKIAYDRLEEGAAIVLETPNPTCLAIYTHAFYMDPSHQKPVHPLTMKYVLEKSGFTNIDIVYTNTSKLPISIPQLEIENTGNIAEFNKAMQIVSDVLFGSQDYAIIGTK